MFHDIAESFATTLSTIIEIIAAIVIAIGLVYFLVQYFRKLTLGDNTHTQRQLRLQFGGSLTLSLELLLAADILATAIAPTWDEIGKLGAIAAIRNRIELFS